MTNILLISIYAVTFIIVILLIVLIKLLISRRRSKPLGKMKYHRFKNDLECANENEQKGKTLDKCHCENEESIEFFIEKYIDNYYCKFEKDNNLLRQKLTDDLKDALHEIEKKTNVLLENNRRAWEENIPPLQRKRKDDHKLKDNPYLLQEKVEYLLTYKNKLALCFESEQIWRNVKQYSKEQLDETYCIVTFLDSQRDPSNYIVQDCFEGRKKEKNLKKKEIRIHEARDVLKLPTSKVMLVCIESNVNNTILETLGKDESDLRVLTVKSCRKSNADVFVIYYGDIDSESLMPGLLYNPQIAAVTEHPDLKDLEKYDRVITCYKKLTITQKEKLAEFIV